MCKERLNQVFDKSHGLSPKEDVMFGFEILWTLFFIVMGVILARLATRYNDGFDPEKYLQTCSMFSVR